MKSKKETIAWQILEFIGKKHNGATFTEIQEFIWNLRGDSMPDFWKKDKYGNRESRGFYCISLYGSSNSFFGGEYGHGGLLNLYCEKKNGKWFLKTMPEEGEKIYCAKSELERREIAKKMVNKNITKDQFEEAKKQVIEEMENESGDVYVLVKAYPGSPTPGLHVKNMGGYYGSILRNFSINEVEKFPEFWQKTLNVDAIKKELIEFNSRLDEIINADEYGSEFGSLLMDIQNKIIVALGF